MTVHQFRFHTRELSIHLILTLIQRKIAQLLDQTNIPRLAAVAAIAMLHTATKVDYAGERRRDTYMLNALHATPKPLIVS